MEKEINILQLITVLLKKWYIIIICAIVFLSASVAYTKLFLAPVYVSQGMIVVANANKNNLSGLKVGDITIGDLAASQQLALTYIEILKSESFMRKLIQENGLDMSAQEMRSRISIVSKNETEVLQISARHSDPWVAQGIVTSALVNSKAEIARILQGGFVEIIDEASLPFAPSGPNLLKNALLSLVLSFALSCALILLLDILDSRIKGQEDLSFRYAYPILGLIPLNEPKNIQR